MIASIYIHVPFCATTCDYCDFYSIKVKPNDKCLDFFIKKILEDFEVIINIYKIKNIPTLYFGGGTPSLLGAQRISYFLHSINSLITAYSISSPYEITLEANPEHCDEVFLKAAKESGINRLSIGVQSFNEASRKAVNRAGQGRVLHDKLETIAEYYSENSSNSFSIDLISGLPFQNEKDLIEDINRILEFKPCHISLYQLTVDPSTSLGKHSAANQVQLPSKDKADRLWLLGRDKIEEAGLRQYEVSNFSLPGKESLHNLRYWHMQNWIGLGPAASSTLINDETGTGIRITNNADFIMWLERKTGIKAPSNIENLNTQELIKETFLMGFRLLDGPDITLFKQRFNKNIEEIIPKTINSWRSKGLFTQERISLTKDGLLFLNSFLIEAFEEMSN